MPALAFAGDKIKVMVIDTGIDAKHPALAHYVSAQDQLDNPLDYQDPHGHGTHITGLITKDVCDRVEIYSCAYNSDVRPSMSTVVACLNRAFSMDMDIVN